MSETQKPRVCTFFTAHEATAAYSIAGFSRDIGATPDDLNLAVSLFFITFVLFQPPSAAVGRWLGAKHWISIMMVILYPKMWSERKLTAF